MGPNISFHQSIWPTAAEPKDTATQIKARNKSLFLKNFIKKLGEDQIKNVGQLLIGEKRVGPCVGRPPQAR